MALDLNPETRSFLEQPHFAVVATIAPDGMPHQTVMWYALWEDGLLLNTPYESLKHQHLRRDPRISVCVEAGYRYVTFVGHVRLNEEAQQARQDYQHLGQRYQGTLAQRPQFDGSPPPLLLRERVSIYVTVERIIGQ